MIVHLSPDDKFIEPFIRFNRVHFSPNEHVFFITLSNGKKSSSTENNDVFYSPKNWVSLLLFYVQLLKKLSRAQGILLHSLADFSFVLLLYLLPSLRKKSCWYIWGRDLYAYSDEKKTVKYHIKEFFRRAVIQDLGKIVTYLDGDVELARKWYGTKATYHYCYMYHSNLYKKVPSIKRSEEGFSILAGNSADPLNNHFELFDFIKQAVDEKPVTIYAPLSYGGTHEYKQNVIKAGYALFGSRFKPITDFMQAEDYYQFLGNISVGIFNHKRQMGMGNMISLLGLGKKVFLRTEFSSYTFFNQLGLHVFSIDSLQEHLFSEIDLTQNEQILSAQLNEENLKHQLADLYASFYIK